MNTYNNNKYADIGKTANDLLLKDFPVQVIRVEAKGSEKTSHNVVSKFNVTGTRDSTTGIIVGEVKNTLTALLSRPSFSRKDSSSSGIPGSTAPLVLECTSTLGSNGSVSQQVEMKDPLVKGLNIGATGTLLTSGPANIKFNLDYARALNQNLFLTKNLSVEMFKGPAVTNEATLRYGGMLLGAHCHWNIEKTAMDNYSAAIGYDVNNYKASLHALNKGNSLAAAFYQRFTSGIETGFKATWNRKTTTAYGIEVVGKFPLDPGSFVKAKMDNTGKVGLAYSTLVNSKVTMTIAGNFDTMKGDNAHRIGMGFVVDM